MAAVCFEVEFLIHGAQSLKDKRMVVRSVKDRCKARFNVSVVECGHADKWQLARMGFAIAAISQTEADQHMQAVIDYLDADGRIEIIHIETY
jgi:uncharacterized protein YlxP (DUF503 family)